MEQVLLTTFLILITLTAIVGVWFIVTQNSLVNAEENINFQWSEVANQYQRRYDLIPRLVNATKMYINYETNLLTQITEARSQWGAALASQNTAEMAEAASGFERVVGRLLMVTSVENYPELKGDTLVMGLMDELAGTENRIAVARQRYNRDVITYNKKLRFFPGSIIANMLGFEPRDTFDIQEDAWQAPEVPT